MLMRRIKYALASIVTRHPYFWYVAWRLMPHLTFLLPHEKSYYGFKHLATQKEGLFLDVGANNGLSALGFRHLVPSYRILSIEANRYHEPSLRKLKQRLVNFDYRITAAGNENSEFTLYTAMYGDMMLHTGASLNLDYLKKGLEGHFPKYVVKRLTYDQQIVKVIKLDDLHVAPDVIKTDAEGFDFEVLVGLRDTIVAHRPSILVEYSPPLPGRLDPFCKELSYSLFIYDDRNDQFLAFDAQRELREHLSGGSPVNLFLVPTERVSTLPVRSI